MNSLIESLALTSLLLIRTQIVTDCLSSSPLTQDATLRSLTPNQKFVNQAAIADAESSSIAKFILNKRQMHISVDENENEVDPEVENVLSWIECLFDDECLIKNKDYYIFDQPENSMKGTNSQEMYLEETNKDMNNRRKHQAIKNIIEKNNDIIMESKKNIQESEFINEILEEESPQNKKRVKKSIKLKSSTTKSRRARNSLATKNKTELSLMKCLFEKRKNGKRLNQDEPSSSIHNEISSVEYQLQSQALNRRLQKNEAVKGAKSKRESASQLKPKKGILSKEEEIDLATKVQQGIKLQQIKADFETANEKNLTRNEWAELSNLESVSELERILHSSQEAKDMLVTCNMGLVYSIVKQHRKLFTKVQSKEEELVQEGCLGLIRAAELFDPTKGYRFSTYATIWIKGVVGNSKVDQAIAIPTREKSRWNKIQQAKVNLGISENVGLNLDSKTLKKIAMEANMREEEVSDVIHKMTKAKHVLSLDHEYSSSNQNRGDQNSKLSLYKSLYDVSSSSYRDVCQLRSDVLNALQTTLNEREIQILKMRYGLDGKPSRTVMECATEIGLSRARVQQIATSSLSKLRDAGKDVECLQEYLLTI